MTNSMCHIGIIGCGLGGLAAAIAIRRAGHKVTIVEQTMQLSEIGAGIEVPPNSTRILKRWNMLEAVKFYSIQPERLQLRSYRDGSILSNQSLIPSMEDTYGAPWLLIHRANFQKVLVREAEKLGVQFRMGFPVTKIDHSPLSIASSSTDTVIRVDAILGADGLHSICRSEVQANCESVLVTRDMAYRITIRAEDMRNDIRLSKLLEIPVINAWLGPNAHVVSYTLKETGLYNFVFICRVQLDGIGDIHDFFKEWDPRLRLLLEIAEKSRKWDLYTSNEMETWIHPKSAFALLGDACHPMHPYLSVTSFKILQSVGRIADTASRAQGAAQAFEDAAVLGALFSEIKSRGQIREALLKYEQLRKPRATRMVQESSANGRILHMPNGKEQEERDRELRFENPFQGFPNRWADPVFQRWLFDYDASDEVEKLGKSPARQGIEKDGKVKE